MQDDREDIRRELTEEFLEEIHFQRIEEKLASLGAQLDAEQAKPDADLALVARLASELKRIRREDYLNFDLTRQELLGSR